MWNMCLDFEKKENETCILEVVFGADSLKNGKSGHL